jgi:hypothetical protein
MITTDIISSSEPRNCELCNRDISQELSLRGPTGEETSETIGLCCYEHLNTIEHVSIPDSLRPEEVLAILDQLRCASQGIQLTLESVHPAGNAYSLHCPGITQIRSTAGSYTDAQIVATAQRVPNREWPDAAKRLAMDVKSQAQGTYKLVLYKWPDGIIAAFNLARHLKRATGQELIRYYRIVALHLMCGSTCQ